MLDFLFEHGWGAFTIMLLFQIPFLIVFTYLVYRKTAVDAGPSNTGAKRLSRLEGLWLSVAIGLFVLVNLLSIGYMPTVATARAAISEKDIKEVNVEARSWGYAISERNFEVGDRVRFSATSLDTMHSFTVYHPDGRILINMMLMPGLETPASLIHTFDEPGAYKVRCLEYCGIAHHGMQDQLVVADNNG